MKKVLVLMVCALACSALFLSGCHKNDDPNEEVGDEFEIIVTTNEVTDVTTCSAVCGGIVTEEGGAEVMSRGVCWSMFEEPTISDNITCDSCGTGSFISQIVDLLPNTTYYVRAYATSDLVVVYGEQRVFTTQDVFVENFETGDFTAFNWQNDGEYPWEITSNEPYEGNYCMKSSNEGVNNSSSSIELTIELPREGMLSFWVKTSSENIYDKFSFYIDGERRCCRSGIDNWRKEECYISIGTHVLKWEYTKDESTSRGDDCIYIDCIDFCHDYEPILTNWHTYAQSEFNNALGSLAGGHTGWAYQYPSIIARRYSGRYLTKVALFSDSGYNAVGGNYTCYVCVGGDVPMVGEVVSTITVDVPKGLNDWVEYELDTPVAITGEQFWVVWTANTQVSSWPAGQCSEGDYSLGTWFIPNITDDYPWERVDSGVWTMKNYFADEKGRTVTHSFSDINMQSDNASQIKTDSYYAPIYGDGSIIMAAPNVYKK